MLGHIQGETGAFATLCWLSTESLWPSLIIKFSIPFQMSVGQSGMALVWLCWKEVVVVVVLEERLELVVVVMLEEGLRLSENISHWLALAVLRPNSNWKLCSLSPSWQAELIIWRNDGHQHFLIIRSGQSTSRQHQQFQGDTQPQTWRIILKIL